MPDPQETPDEVVGTEDGQSQEVEEPAVAIEPVADPTADQLKELSEKNKDLQRRLTQQGRELAEQRRSSSETAPKPEGSFWETPEATLDAKFAAFEERQEQRRQAEQLLHSFAEERGIPVRDLQRLDGELRNATADPQDYLDVLARLQKAETTAQAIQSATQQAVKTVKGNARAVTAEGGAAQPAPTEKSEDDMTVEELRASYVKKYGEVPPEQG